jgi:DNA primase
MDQVNEIKEKNDIVDVVSSYIDLKKAGINYKASCPFHKEKDPSFMVNPERQIYKCFGCGEGGDVIDFIENIEGVEFPDALKILADRAGVKLKQIDREEFRESKDLYATNELSADFYAYILKNQEAGEKALSYLKDQRGLDLKSIDKFKLGYAPKSWQSLTKFLKKKGHSQDNIIKAGLAIEGKNDSIYDRFRGRIMIPIFNPAGRIVGFSSRILPEYDDGKMGKYINSPETQVFNKSKILYGKNFANKSIREKNQAILVEGQFDVISSHINGFKNTVASSGTALTQEQINLIARIAETIIFAFDKDSAGGEATKKGIDLALMANLEVKIALIPGKFKDVDEVVQANPDLWQKALEDSKEIIAYYFSQTIPKDSNNLSANQKRKIAKILIKQISKTEDPIVQGDWIQKLSEKLEIDQDFLYQALDKYSADDSRESQDQLSSKSTNLDKEERFLGLIMTFEDIFDKIKSKFDPSLLKNKKLSQLYTKVEEEGLNNLKGSQKKLADRLILEVENDYEEEDEATALEEIKQVIAKIKSYDKEEIKTSFARKIKEAEQAGDIKKVKELIKKFQKAI